MNISLTLLCLLGMVAVSLAAVKTVNVPQKGSVKVDPDFKKGKSVTEFKIVPCKGCLVEILCTFKASKKSCARTKLELQQNKFSETLCPKKNESKQKVKFGKGNIFATFTTNGLAKVVSCIARKYVK